MNFRMMLMIGGSLLLAACEHTSSAPDEEQIEVFEDTLPTDSNELIKLAEQGDPDAQNRVGEMYHFAEGVDRNYQEAMKWYKRANQSCHPVAPNHIGRLYFNGEGVKQDFAQATKWYLISAERGDPAAQWNMAMAYNHGNGVGKDLKKAYFWYGLVAKNPDVADMTWFLDGRKVKERAQEHQQEIAKRLKKSHIDRINAEIEAWRPKPCNS